MIDVIAFDAEDTLWHNETLYMMTEEKFKQLLSAYRSLVGTSSPARVSTRSVS